MKKSINRTIRVKFATFDELNIEKFFCKSRDLFYLFLSDSVKVDAKEVPKGERSKITLWQNKYIEECVVSKTNGGFTITENDYIEYELLECNNLYEELKKYPPLYADLKLKRPLVKYIEFLNARLKRNNGLDKFNHNFLLTEISKFQTTDEKIKFIIEAKAEFQTRVSKHIKHDNFNHDEKFMKDFFHTMGGTLNFPEICDAEINKLRSLKDNGLVQEPSFVDRHINNIVRFVDIATRHRITQSTIKFLEKTTELDVQIQNEIRFNNELPKELAKHNNPKPVLQPYLVNLKLLCDKYFKWYDANKHEIESLILDDINYYSTMKSVMEGALKIVRDLESEGKQVSVTLEKKPGRPSAVQYTIFECFHEIDLKEKFANALKERFSNCSEKEFPHLILALEQMKLIKKLPRKSIYAAFECFFEKSYGSETNKNNHYRAPEAKIVDKFKDEITKLKIEKTII